VSFAEECALTAEKAVGHGELEGGAFLAHVGGREVDGDGLMAGIIETTIFESGFDALAAFLDGDVRKADDIEISGLAGANVDFDEIGFDAVDRGGVSFEEHERGEFVPYCLGARQRRTNVSRPDKLFAQASVTETRERSSRHWFRATILFVVWRIRTSTFRRSPIGNSLSIFFTSFRGEMWNVDLSGNEYWIPVKTRPEVVVRYLTRFCEEFRQLAERVSPETLDDGIDGMLNFPFFNSDNALGQESSAAGPCRLHPVDV
jgi:hypothetical protein